MVRQSTKILAGIILAAASLTGCSQFSDDIDEPTLTEHSSTASPSPAANTEAAGTTTIESGPSFVKCEKKDTAQLADGSTVTDTRRCGDFEEESAQPEQPEQPKRPAQSEQPAAPEAPTAPPAAPAAPAEPECTGGAAECGYGHDEQGNPNPSSGELQTQYGCEQGYITDPELCAAVRDL